MCEALGEKCDVVKKWSYLLVLNELYCLDFIANKRALTCYKWMERHILVKLLSAISTVYIVS